MSESKPHDYGKMSREEMAREHAATQETADERAREAADGFSGNVEVTGQ